MVKRNEKIKSLNIYKQLQTTDSLFYELKYITMPTKKYYE